MDFSTAWINGRSLAKSLSTTKARNSFGKFGPTDRVGIELPRDLYALGLDLENPVPFVVEENILITAHDVDEFSEIIDFTNIRFTKNAFESALSELNSEKLITELEHLGMNISDDSDKVLKFSELVCKWGRGQRVWGNLIRHYTKEKLGAELCQWLLSARNQENANLAISQGVAIKGLGVSFASKHLRHLAPDRFGVLDDVISQGLGYALNPAGYNLFISDLRRLQNYYFPEVRIADIEAGLFLLIRQIVRGRKSD